LAPRLVGVPVAEVEAYQVLAGIRGLQAAPRAVRIAIVIEAK
jgi:hypothetical protein